MSKVDQRRIFCFLLLLRNDHSPRSAPGDLERVVAETEGRSLEVVGVASVGTSHTWEQVDMRSSSCVLSCVNVRQLLFRSRVSVAEGRYAKPLEAAEGLEEGQRYMAFCAHLCRLEPFVLFL